MIRVTLLGTGGSAGVPMIGGEDGAGDWGVCDPAEPRNRRTRTSIAVQAEGSTLLVDTGPDLRGQLIAAGIGRVESTPARQPRGGGPSGISIIRSQD